MIEGIGGWVRLHPAAFLTDQYLKYVAWALSDKVRCACCARCALCVCGSGGWAGGRGTACGGWLCGWAGIRASLRRPAALPPSPSPTPLPPPLKRPRHQDARVRLASVSALLALYSNPDNKPALADFTQRFQQRFGELFYDRDEAVAVKGVRMRRPGRHVEGRGRWSGAACVLA